MPAAFATRAAVAEFRAFRCSSGVVISPSGIGLKFGTDVCIIATLSVPKQNGSVCAKYQNQ